MHLLVPMCHLYILPSVVTRSFFLRYYVFHLSPHNQLSTFYVQIVKSSRLLFSKALSPSDHCARTLKVVSPALSLLFFWPIGYNNCVDPLLHLQVRSKAVQIKYILTITAEQQLLLSIPCICFVFFGYCPLLVQFFFILA